MGFLVLHSWDCLRKAMVWHRMLDWLDGTPQFGSDWCNQDWLDGTPQFGQSSCNPDLLVDVVMYHIVMHHTVDCVGDKVLLDSDEHVAVDMQDNMLEERTWVLVQGMTLAGMNLTQYCMALVDVNLLDVKNVSSLFGFFVPQTCDKKYTEQTYRILYYIFCTYSVASYVVPCEHP